MTEQGKGELRRGTASQEYCKHRVYRHVRACRSNGVGMMQPQVSVLTNVLLYHCATTLVKFTRGESTASDLDCVGTPLSHVYSSFKLLHNLTN